MLPQPPALPQRFPAPSVTAWPFVPIARVLRAGLVESWHCGAVAAATPDGRLVAIAGAPELAASFLRSAAKPFQAMSLLAAGGRERFDLSSADLALVCASHGGTPAHVQRASTLLARGGFTVQDLLCGIHPPLDAEAARELTARRREPTPLHNGCSGKHAGMLLACCMRKLPTGDYIAPEHPVQKENLRHLALCARVRPEEVGLATDGCSVPTYRLSVAAAARAYAVLADPDLAGLPGVSSLATAIVGAMTDAPEMVAGPGRFTTRLMQVTRGRILAKEGYEGFYALAVRGPVALGVAIKIADGGERCRDGVVLETLLQLGCLSAAELTEIRDLHRPQRRNHRGLVVGEIVPEVHLEEVE